MSEVIPSVVVQVVSCNLLAYNPLTELYLCLVWAPLRGYLPCIIGQVRIVVLHLDRLKSVILLTERH